MLSEWLEQHIWPQIQAMLLNDAYFKLMGHARELTEEFNGPIAGIIVNGYVTYQMVAIRRLCDNGRNVISLRRLLVESDSNNQVDYLSKKLDSCEHICGLVNNYVAHTANPLRNKNNFPDWNLQVGHLIEAQKAICEVAIILDRDLLQRQNLVQLIPVHQDGELMQDFRNWVSESTIEKLWVFWHAHRNEVNSWIPSDSNNR
jgi:hypothetical protein